MAPPTLYVAITNHGFGHATRAASVIAEIQNKCPDSHIIVTTTAPQWLIDSYLRRPVTYRQRAFDIGVIQSDSVTMDKAATLAKLQQIRANQAAIIEAEARFIQQENVDLILADIPPLVAPIARTADVPCWMMSNFGWDLIYRDWGGEFIDIADWISECFSQCDRLFRLPFYEPMAAFSLIDDVGLTGGTPRFSMDDLRQTWHLTAPIDKTVLLTFGGLGLAKIPYDGLNQYSDWQFLTFDRDAPNLPNLVKITDRRYRPVDVMPLCSRVVSKPGYGTFSEACRLGIPLVTIERDGFAEATFLIDGIQRHAYHQILKPDELLSGTWDFLKQSMSPPTETESVIPIDGNDAIAQAVADVLRRP
jgi:hypothetical protein